MPLLWLSIAFIAGIIIANTVILPVQPPIMIIGGLALILALIWFPLGKIIAVVA